MTQAVKNHCAKAVMLVAGAATALFQKACLIAAIMLISALSQMTIVLIQKMTQGTKKLILHAMKLVAKRSIKSQKKKKSVPNAFVDSSAQKTHFASSAKHVESGGTPLEAALK